MWGRRTGGGRGGRGEGGAEGTNGGFTIGEKLQ